MDYDYLKARPLNQLEIRRLRMAIRLEKQLRSMSETGIKNFSFDTFAPTLFRNKDNKVNRMIEDWALCYAPPRLLKMLLRCLEEDEFGSGYFSYLRQVDPALLLPRDYISPDIQTFQRTDQEPKTALVCFTGNTLRLNVPVQLFHALVVDTFDLVVYLRDEKKQRFIYGVGGLAIDLEELADVLLQIIPESCHIATLGTSSGGIAASRIGEEIGAKKLALFSPVFEFNNIYAIKDDKKFNSNNAVLYFAKNNFVDEGLIDFWGDSHLSNSIHILDDSSHGTLLNLVKTDNFKNLVNWLAADKEALNP